MSGLDGELDKLDQAVVLYFPKAAVVRREGTRCGSCWKFVKTGMCVEVIGSIDPKKTCGLYVNGTPFDDLPALSVSKVTKSEAGYGDGDTNCGNCKHLGGPGMCERVKSGPAKIEAGGCCNEHAFKRSRSKS